MLSLPYTADNRLIFRSGSLPHIVNVSILSRDEVHTLADSWGAESLRRVLELADADDLGEVADSELEDICVMALQDIGNRRAAEVVLETVFAESMRPGVRQNLVDDLQEDQPWSDFGEISQQRGIFVAVGLLQKAFPTLYGTPDAVQLTLKVQADAALALNGGKPPSPAWVICLLAGVLGQDNILHRLYGDELKKRDFEFASGLIWELDSLDDQSGNERSLTIIVTAASQLLGALSAGGSVDVSLP